MSSSNSNISAARLKLERTRRQWLAKQHEDQLTQSFPANDASALGTTIPQQTQSLQPQTQPSALDQAYNTEASPNPIQIPPTYESQSNTYNPSQQKFSSHNHASSSSSHSYQRPTPNYPYDDQKFDQGRIKGRGRGGGRGRGRGHFRGRGGGRPYINNNYAHSNSRDSDRRSRNPHRHRSNDQNNHSRDSNNLAQQDLILKSVEQAQSTLQQLSEIEKELNLTTRSINRPRLTYINSSTSSFNNTNQTSNQAPPSSEWAFIDDSDVSNFSSQLPNPAITFPFELDDFQKRAILNIEVESSVFVAAHTSAGKTVVAEYAIAMAQRHGAKAFYTSPIKSLSNQKLRDLRSKFGDVGLVTGDVSINENGQCVVMTTEILRSMLYRGADSIRDLKWVIFDEVQYLNDEERGVVWEETIIMLPEHVNIVMLSATVPNAMEFSEWVGRTKARRVAVVVTGNRPVPLKHVLLASKKIGIDETTGESYRGMNELILLEQGQRFREDSYIKGVREMNGQKKEEKEEEKKQRRKDSKRERRAQKRDTPRNSDDNQQNSAGGIDGTNKNNELIDRNHNINGEYEDEHYQNNELPGLSDINKNSELEEIDSPTVTSIENTGIESYEDLDEQSKVSPGKDKKTILRKTGNVNKGVTAKSKAFSASKSATGNGGSRNKTSPWRPLVGHLQEKALFPAIVFCFSKKKCELAVQSLESLDLLPNAQDKNHVHSFVNHALSRLRAEDRDLPQVIRTYNNLKRGISAHHAGLLPLVKEVTEMLFAEGYVKLLFATETFAIGVNMPARSVVFSAVQKHDGRRKRMLDPGEYTQMSGRAGRRGIDTVGHVFVHFAGGERVPDVVAMKKMMTALPFSLKSAFRLTYNMILNVLRVDELRVEEVMKQSFSEAGLGVKADDIGQLLTKVGTTLGELNIESNFNNEGNNGNNVFNKYTNEVNKVNREGIVSQTGSDDHLKRYVELFGRLKLLSEKISHRQMSNVVQKYITPGRLVIAEVEPGRLALCTIFSLVPPSSRATPYQYQQHRGYRDKLNDWVNASTLVWLAAVVGVDKRKLRRHVRSCLILHSTGKSTFARQNEKDYSNGNERNSVEEELQVTTNEGLIVCIKSVPAFRIVYFSDVVDENVDEKRIKDQRVSSFVWHTRKTGQGLKFLGLCATFLENMLKEWKQRNVMENKISMGGDSIDEGSSSNEQDKTLETNPLRRAIAKEVSSANGRTFLNTYLERVGVCLDIVCDAEIATTLNSCGGRNIISHIGTIIMQSRVHKQMEVLQKLKDGNGNEPTLLPEYNKRVKVLQRLGYIGEDGLCVFLKGRCACEVSTVDSVVLTEIIMENVLNELSVAEIASLLSSLLCRKKNEGGVELVQPADMEIYGQRYLDAKMQMMDVVKRVGDVQTELGVTLQFEMGDDIGGSYENAICRWDLARAVYAWASGEAFLQVAEMTTQQEGDIVVCVKRLCELLKDAQSVARGVGNLELVTKLEHVVDAIRRDVVFNASLYFE